MHRVIEVGYTYWPVWAMGVVAFFSCMGFLGFLYSFEEPGFLVFVAICLAICLPIGLTAPHYAVRKQDQIQVRLGTSSDTLWTNAHKLPDGKWWPDDDGDN